jgi:predicted hotdog family 3-hydroxylacyl-ACP dehydratase
VAPSFQGALEELIPHRGAMSLLSRLLDDAADWVRVEAVISRGGVFVGERGLPAWVGLELMAQAIAVWGGLRSRGAQTPVQAGLLLGTRRFECTQPYFPLGARLEVEARRDALGDNGLAVFSCRIVLEGAQVATATVNVFSRPVLEPHDG